MRLTIVTGAIGGIAVAVSGFFLGRLFTALAIYRAFLGGLSIAEAGRKYGVAPLDAESCVRLVGGNPILRWFGRVQFRFSGGIRGL